MSKCQATVVYEYTWRQFLLEGSEHEYVSVRTFRVVAERYDFDHGKLSGFTCEEMYPDALGVTSWHRASEDTFPPRALADLLQKAGLLPADEDLSCVS